MIHLPASVRVYLATSPSDMRRSFDGLHALVNAVLQSGCLCRTSVRVGEPPAGSGEDFVLGCVTNVSENLQSCTEDGRRPPGVGFQELASNHPELLRSKGVVVNVRGKGVREGRQVSVEKMSESEPTDDASSRIQGTVKTGAAQ
jgi:hypothetical protein